MGPNDPSQIPEADLDVALAIAEKRARLAALRAVPTAIATLEKVCKDEQASTPDRRRAATFLLRSSTPSFWVLPPRRILDSAARPIQHNTYSPHQPHTHERASEARSLDGRGFVAGAPPGAPLASPLHLTPNLPGNHPASHADATCSPPSACSAEEMLANLEEFNQVAEFVRHAHDVGFTDHEIGRLLTEPEYARNVRADLESHLRTRPAKDHQARADLLDAGIPIALLDSVAARPPPLAA